MISCASLKLALCMGAAMHGDSVPVSFAARVRADIATRWEVDSALLQLEWAAVGHPAAIGDDTPFHLTGRGIDGWLLVVVTPTKGAPQAIRVRAGVLRTVPVAAHALRMGQRLTQGDVELRRDLVWSATATDFTTSFNGWEVRRDIPAGTMLSAATVIAPRVIAVGDPVVFVWMNHGVRIEREALAVSPARLGEMVQGQAGLTRLTGKAIAPGLAQMKESGP